MTRSIDKLLDVMKKLRDPNGGCPWDLEQNFKTITPYTLEEAYEVVEAVENNDMSALQEELGDLLLQVVFYAQLAKEAQLFDFEAIAEKIATKMIERHPHVFGDKIATTADEVLSNWESNKAEKRKTKAESENKNASVLDGVNTALPALSRALKLQQRAARVGFDWKDTHSVLGKVYEELAELEVETGLIIKNQTHPDTPSAGADFSANANPQPIAKNTKQLPTADNTNAYWTAETSTSVIKSSATLEKKEEPNSKPDSKPNRHPNSDAIEDEMGDVLFAAINLARHFGVDPEKALRRTNRKFESRFRQIENKLGQQGKKIEDTSLDQMESVWNEIKKTEKNGT